MSDPIRFTLDGAEVEAQPGETIWQVAQRLGTEIPHLCWLPEARLPRRRQLPRLHGRDRGRARARRLVHPQADRRHEGADRRASAPGSRARWCSSCWSATSPSATVAHDPNSSFWQWADRLERQPTAASRGAPSPAPDRSHPAMAVQLDACIQCNLCVRACREVQVNDVIGMAARGHHEKIVFDFDDPMGNSTCVACGECVQACPTGALMPATLVDANGVYANAPDREVDSVCPYCGVGCQLTYKIKDDRIVAVEGKRRAGQPQPALRQGPLRLRLRPPSRPADRAADPQGRRLEARHRYRPGQPLHAFPQGELGGGARPRRRAASSASATGTGGARSPGSARPRARTRRPICSRSWCAPGSAATMSTIARGCATPRRSRR